MDLLKNVTEWYIENFGFYPTINVIKTINECESQFHSSVKEGSIDFANWIINDYGTSKWNGYNHYCDKNGMAFKASELYEMYLKQIKK